MQSPYNITEHEGNFSFKTDLDFEYKITFQKHTAFNTLGYASFEFGFYPVGEIESKYDSRIKPTIVFALKDFFQKNPDSIIIYVCDSLDNRARERNILFNRWFNESETKDITRLSRKIFDTENDMIYYFTVAFHQNYISPDMIKSFVEAEEAIYNK